MTHAAPRKRGGRGSAWVVPAVAIAVLVVLVLSGVFSRSIWLDAISWWPIWVVLAAVGFWGRQRRFGSLRMPGLVAVGFLLVLGVFVVGHVRGWTIMPSSVDELVSSSADPYETATLVARVGDGELVLEQTDTGSLYIVSPVRSGGSIAIPESVERSQGTDVAIELTQISDPGMYLFSGWDIGLSAGPAWTLTLEGQLDADLSTTNIANLQLDGSGVVSVGSVSVSTPLTVSGDFLIEVPDGTPVRVVGPAELPPGWERTASGGSSPETGQGWVISVAEGSVVEIRER